MQDPPNISHLIKLPVGQLVPGMFVAGLDRPWRDTPFHLEGLLIQNEEELAALRRHCRHAWIDPQRSTDVVEHLLRLRGRPRPSALAASLARPGQSGQASGIEHAAEIAPERPPERATGRTLGKRSMRADRDASRLRVCRLHKRLLAWLARRASPTLAERSVASDHKSRARTLQTHSSIQLRSYPPAAPISAELPHAREAWMRSTMMLRSVHDAVVSGTPPDLSAAQGIAGAIAASMIRSPDATLWAAQSGVDHAQPWVHCLKVAMYLVALGRQIGLSERDLRRVALIGLLADIGKFRLPDALLSKPGLLTNDEHDIVKQHVRLGLDIVRSAMPIDPLVERGILEHHERMDGSGYPKGTKGPQISLFGRMTGLADCFTALTSDRYYALAQSPQEAMLHLAQWAGSSFHEPLTEQFVAAIGMFPVGSLVELSNAEVGIVLARNPASALSPRVFVLLGPTKLPLPDPVERCLRVARGLHVGAFGLDSTAKLADIMKSYPEERCNEARHGPLLPGSGVKSTALVDP